MFTPALRVFLYEVAVRTLPRVCLKDRLGVVGVLLQQDFVAKTSQVHWGVSDGKVVQTWHRNEDIRFVQKKEKPNAS